MGFLYVFTLLSQPVITSQLYGSKFNLTRSNSEIRSFIKSWLSFWDCLNISSLFNPYLSKKDISTELDVTFKTDAIVL